MARGRAFFFRLFSCPPDKISTSVSSSSRSCRCLSSSPLSLSLRSSKKSLPHAPPPSLLSASSSSFSSSSQSRHECSSLPSKAASSFSSVASTLGRTPPLKDSGLPLSTRHRRLRFLSSVYNLLALATMWSSTYTSASGFSSLPCLSAALPSSPFFISSSSSLISSLFSFSRRFSPSSSSLRPLFVPLHSSLSGRSFSFISSSVFAAASSSCSISPPSALRDSSCSSSFFLLSSGQSKDSDGHCSTPLFLSSSSSPLSPCFPSSPGSSSSPCCPSPRTILSVNALSRHSSTPAIHQGREDKVSSSITNNTDPRQYACAVRTASHVQPRGSPLSSRDSSYPGKRSSRLHPFSTSSRLFSSSSSYSQKLSGSRREGKEGFCQSALDNARQKPASKNTQENGEGAPEGGTATLGAEQGGRRVEDRSDGSGLGKEDAWWGYYLEGEQAEEELKKLLRGSPYTRVTQGTEGEKSFQVFVKDASRLTDRRLLSPWHDIPLIVSGDRRTSGDRRIAEEEDASRRRAGVEGGGGERERQERGGEQEEGGEEEEELLFNAVIEIPKNTRKKMEIQTHLALNPIMQDVKPDGELREYASTMYWNYGAFPQTWEDPRVAGGPEVFFARGDADPLDVVEIGGLPLPPGTVVPVKVLGALAMIDKGELDWKVIAIRQGDPLFSKLKNGLQDVERYCPGLISGIREWFRWYKLPTDNALSVFGHEERAVSASVAREVVLHAHRHYVEFLQQETERRRKKMAEGRRVEESKQRLTDEASIDEKELSSFWIPLKE